MIISSTGKKSMSTRPIARSKAIIAMSTRIIASSTGKTKS